MVHRYHLVAAAAAAAVSSLAFVAAFGPCDLFVVDDTDEQIVLPWPLAAHKVVWLGVVRRIHVCVLA